jgi:Uma2 family endonuclease
MVAMTTAEPWPAAGQLFTVDDLDRMPDDGRRYELVDGVLIVSPAPQLPHQFVLTELIVCLHGACPPGLFVVPGPGVRMSVDTELIPDLVVIRQDQLAERWVTRPPLLAVEIQSPSTALFDLNTKKAVCERFSIESYWVVVPDVDWPELIAFELCDGRYQQVARVTGAKPFRAERPFPVEVVPARLVSGLLPPG